MDIPRRIWYNNINHQGASHVLHRFFLPYFPPTSTFLSSRGRIWGVSIPAERFYGRVEKLLRNASISLTARDERGLPVGGLPGLTDFAYRLYVTDLGADREWTHRGIGSALMKQALEAAGGEKDIAVYLIANDKAVPFYGKPGMEKAGDVMNTTMSAGRISPSERILRNRCVMVVWTPDRMEKAGSVPPPS